jgi:hypothetical protein
MIQYLYPGDHRYFDLQPASASESFGEIGNGWKGVRRWCREIWLRPGSSLERILSQDTGAPLDILIIQVDADIVQNHDLQEGNSIYQSEVAQPCPPIGATITRLKSVIKQWLNISDRDPVARQVIFAIPSQDMENWIFAALHPNDPLCQFSSYECIKSGRWRNEHPGYLLTLKRYGKWLNRRSTIKKPVPPYKALIAEIEKTSERWENTFRICSQARDFRNQLDTAISQHDS